MRIAVGVLAHVLLIMVIWLTLEESDCDDQREEFVVVLADAIKQAASTDQLSTSSLQT